MKAFINFYGEFQEDKKFLKLIAKTSYPIVKRICPDALDDFEHYASGIAKRNDLDICMTYVYGRLLPQIRSFYGYDIDLYNFLKRTVLDNDG